MSRTQSEYDRLIAAHRAVDPVEPMLAAIGEAIQGWWIADMKKSDLSPRVKQAYANSVRFWVDRQNWKVTIGFPSPEGGTSQDDMWALMHELGFGPAGIDSEGPYDMRRYMLNGKLQVHTAKKGGTYVNVPMNKSAKWVQGWAKSENVMPKRTVAEELARAKKNPRFYAAGDDGAMRAQNKGHVYSLKDSVKKLKAQHASDPFHRMVAVAGGYSAHPATGQPRVEVSAFRMWRVMWLNRSDNWIHPGIPAKRIKDGVLQGGRMDDVQQQVNEINDKLVGMFP